MKLKRETEPLSFRRVSDDIHDHLWIRKKSLMQRQDHLIPETQRPEFMNSENTILANTVLGKNPRRRMKTPENTDWGRLFIPGENEERQENEKGLKVLAICSWTLGFLAFETLKLMERRLPGKIRIAGLVTDDPTDDKAKISMKRRFWRYYSPGEQKIFTEGILESALSAGIPCYTGQVKSSFFRNLLQRMNPDVIVVAGFGQLIDSPIINCPSMGIYNIHPADLLHHHGAGPQPWEDLIRRGADTTRVTVHRVSETIDSGDVVGQSPPVNVRLAQGKLSDNVRLIGEKTLMPVDHLTAELMSRILIKWNCGERGAVKEINFEALFSDEFKQRLMLPIDPGKEGHLLPLPSNEVQFTV